MCLENCLLFKQDVVVVYLRVFIEQQVECIWKDCNWLLLQNDDLEVVFCKLFVVWDLLYIELVDIIMYID